MHRSLGFTLLELITVVGIAAILSAIAVSTYGRYVHRARRADAQQALLTIANGQERWYATYNRYADDLAKLGFASPSVLPQGHYQLSLGVGPDEAQSYTATAMPIGAQAHDTCGSLSIDSKGSMLPARDDAQANANGNCW